MGERRKHRLFGAGVGAGVLGALLLALRYAVRPVTKARVPDTISPAIFRTKVFRTTLGQVVYHESGSGPALVFIHSLGVGASSYEWSKVYPAFTATHHVLAPDLIGFGESARPDASLTAADYARSLAEFIRGASEQPVVIVASGVGAGLSILLASQHPEAVRQLVLWNPSGIAEPGAPACGIGRRIVSFMPLVHRFIYRNSDSSRVAVRAWLSHCGFADPARVTDETVDVYTTCAQQYGAEHALRSLYSGRLGIDIESRLRSLTQPVTFLWPDGAGEITLRLQAMAPGSRLAGLPRLGPLGPLEAPPEMTAAVTEALDPGPKIVR